MNDEDPKQIEALKSDEGLYLRLSAMRDCLDVVEKRIDHPESYLEDKAKSIQVEIKSLIEMTLSEINSIEEAQVALIGGE